MCKLDYHGYLRYSDYALKTGWSSSELYYNRGVAYERIGNYKAAKEEYKKAKKRGYFLAKQALRDLKKKKK